MRLRPGLGRKRIFAEFGAQETCVVAANVVPRWEQQTALQIFHLDYRGRGGREGKGESTGKGKEGKYGKNGRKTPSWIPEMNFRLEPWACSLGLQQATTAGSWKLPAVLYTTSTRPAPRVYSLRLTAAAQLIGWLTGPSRFLSDADRVNPTALRRRPDWIWHLSVRSAALPPLLPPSSVVTRCTTLAVNRRRPSCIVTGTDRCWSVQCNTTAARLLRQLCT